MSERILTENEGGVVEEEERWKESVGTAKFMS